MHSVYANHGTGKARLVDWSDKVWLAIDPASAIILPEHPILARWFNRRGWSGLITGWPGVWLLVLFLIVGGMNFANRTCSAQALGFGGAHPMFNLTC